MDFVAWQQEEWANGRDPSWIHDHPDKLEQMMTYFRLKDRRERRLAEETEAENHVVLKADTPESAPTESSRPSCQK